MMQWTKPGGLLIIVVPNALSVKGLATKFTPLWFHHLFYKYIYKRTYYIFPTTMSFCVALRAMRRYFADCETVHEEYGEEILSGAFKLFYDFSIRLLRITTFGRWRPERSIQSG